MCTTASFHDANGPLELVYLLVISIGSTKIEGQQYYIAASAVFHTVRHSVTLSVSFITYFMWRFVQPHSSDM